MNEIPYLDLLEFGFLRKKDSRARERQNYILAELEDMKEDGKQRSNGTAGRSDYL